MIRILNDITVKRAEEIFSNVCASLNELYPKVEVSYSVTCEKYCNLVRSVSVHFLYTEMNFTKFEIVASKETIKEMIKYSNGNEDALIEYLTEYVRVLFINAFQAKIIRRDDLKNNEKQEIINNVYNIVLKTFVDVECDIEPYDGCCRVIYKYNAEMFGDKLYYYDEIGLSDVKVLISDAILSIKLAWNDFVMRG